MDSLNVLSKSNIENILPLTKTQTGILFHYLYDNDSRVYYEQYEYVIEPSARLNSKVVGDLSIDKETMEKSIQLVCNNDYILKSVFAWEKLSSPIQVVLKKVLADIDWIDLGDNDVGYEFNKLYNEEIDISIKPIIFRFYSTSANKLYMVVKFHHILLDGWSNAILLNRILETYSKLKSNMGSNDIIYYDEYKKYIRHISDSEKLDKNELIEFWKGKLSNCAWFKLPICNKVYNSISFKTIIKELTSSRIDKINSYVKKNQITLSSLISAAWALVLKEMFDISDVVFGAIDSGRTIPIEGINQMIGMFAHVIPIRVNFETMKSKADLFDYLKKYYIDVLINQNISIPEVKSITETINPIQSLVIIENYPIPSLVQEYIEISSINVREHTNYNLVLFINDNITCDIKLQYNCDIFDDKAANLILERLYTIIDLLLESNPKELLPNTINLFLKQGSYNSLIESGKTEVSNMKNYLLNESFNHRVEHGIIEIIKNMLNIPILQNDKSFLELGGESITAMKIKFAVYKNFNVDLPLNMFFTNDSIQQMIKKFISTIELINENTAETQDKEILSIKHTKKVSASIQQKGIYFAFLSAPDSHAYNNPIFLELSVAMSSIQVDKIISELVISHKILNSSFKFEDFELHIKENRDVKPNVIHINQEDICDFSNVCKIYEAHAKPFEPENYPLMQVIFIKGVSGKSWLIIDISHMIIDGLSLQILLNDLCKLISGIPIDQEKLPYYEYCNYQKQLMDTSDYKCKEEEITLMLKSNLNYLELPHDYKRTKNLGGTAKRIYVKIEDEFIEDFKSACNYFQVTSQMLLLSAYAILLYQETKRKDLLVGIPVFNRPSQEYEHTVGLFSNILPVLILIEKNEPILDFITHIKQSIISAFSYQEVPFESLIDKLNLHLGERYNPLLSNMFSYQKLSKESLSMIDKFLKLHEYDKASPKFDLSVEIIEFDNHISVAFEYAEELFSSNTIENMLGEYLRILKYFINTKNGVVEDAIVNSDNVYESNVLENEQEKMQCLLSKISTTTKDFPNSIAIESKDIQVTYWELEEKSSIIANILEENNCINGNVIACYMQRSEKAIISTLGILKIGAICLPIDSSEKQIDKIESMIKAANVRLILCDSSTAQLAANLSVKTIVYENVSAEKSLKKHYTKKNIDINAYAYCMFTSGSSGTPKGVFLTHKGIYNHALSKIKETGMNCNDVVSQNFRLSFVASIWQIFSPLFVGAKIFVVQEELIKNMYMFFKMLESKKVSIFATIPSFLNAYLSIQSDKWRSPYLKTILLTGEKVIPQYVKNIFEWHPKANLINAYGQTECSDDTLHYKITPYDIDRNSIPIGKPIQNMNIFIMNDEKQVLPDGEIGEICFCGAGVSDGYINETDDNKNKFYLGKDGMVYCTGDYGYINEDGNVEYIGRKDEQIKINGIRLEVGEVLSLIYSLDIVSHCVIIPYVDNNHSTSLKMFYTGDLSVLEIRKLCIDKMPIHMVPKDIYKADKFPISANGKIDKQALILTTNSNDTGVLPTTQSQNILKEIWGEVLDKEHIGISDNLYDLGANSISIMKIMALIYNKFGINISFRDIIQRPSIELLSDLINMQGGKRILKIAKTLEKDYYPTVEQQKRIYWDCVLNKKNSAYINYLAFYIKGNIDLEKLGSAYKVLTDTHSIFDTVFKFKDGDLRQVIKKGDILHELYIESQKCDNIENQISSLLPDFELSKGPLSSFSIIKTDSEGYACLFAIHHIVSDGTTLKVLVKNLFDLYFENETDDDYIDFCDYAVWIEEYSKTNEYFKQQEYWQNEFKHGYPYMKFPMLPNAKDSNIYDKHAVLLEDISIKKIIELTNIKKITLFQFFFSIYMLFVGKITSENTVCVFTPYSRRTKKEIMNSAGMYANNLPIIMDIENNESIWNFINRVKNKLEESYQHQDIFIEELFKDENLHKRYLESDKVMFSYQEAIDLSIKLPKNLEIKPIEIKPHTHKMDLNVEMQETSTGFRFVFEYSKNNLYSASNIASIFLDFVERVVNNSEIKIEELQISMDLNKNDIDLDMKKEEKLKGIWKKAFNKEIVLDSDDFFLLGGDSLKAMQIIQLVYEYFGVDLDFEQLLNKPTFKDFVSLVQNEPIQKKFAATNIQKSIYSQQQLNPDTTAYNMVLVEKIEHEKNTFGEIGEKLD